LAPISTRVQAIFPTMNLLRSLSALSLIALMAQAPLAMAEEPKPEDLAKVEDELATSATRQVELLTAAKIAVEEQDHLSNQLVALAETSAIQERELATVEKRQAKLKTEIAAINLDLAAKQDVISEILAGLQRLAQNPPPALVVAPDDVLGALRGAMLFGTIVPELRNAAQTLHDQLTDLKSLREKFNLDAKQHDEALLALNTSRAGISKLIDEKKALAQSSKQELEMEQKRAEELAAKAISLKQLLAALAEDKAIAEAKQSAEAKARAEAERLADEKAALPQMVFSKSQGQIDFPAQGKIIRRFGDDSGLGTRLDGIVIATAKQAQVTSPVAGKVEFSGKFRSYGQMVIVNPGEGYLVLLAGLEQTLAIHGQSVKAGEPVGTMGDKPGPLATSNGLTNLTTPVLYVEFRKNGDPVDPTPWWIGIRQEAMR
jgi:murein hydrolase activator